ncbi:MAG: LysM peptidoglycan-binding domain-containing protein [Chloroflexi bacterium]|nr:LysM peptidoglycan-binding domain-containing protein [Chloroflexota bacterium]
MGKTWQRALVLALVLSAWAAVGDARADDIYVTVQPGDTLFRIGMRYGLTWQELMQANGLTSTRIYAGQVLRIPGAGTVVSSPPVPTPPLPATYTVARGDTLFNIATRYGLTTGALASANGLWNPKLIYAGQVLASPGGTATPPPAAQAVTGGSQRILVDISEQHMYVYDGGVLLWSWVISTGEPGRETAPGHYSVLNKISMAYAATWDLQMPYWLGIYWAGPLQNGIHALPILSNGEQLWAGWLGTPVSFGCVILGLDEAATLFQWVQLGTAVDIQW